ncbi:MAG: hypothetical protein ACQET5_14080 [Halobacteriota archaeon]|uniref:hypothetical protein n=1 Tax=Natronomonas sp. TaxID=2184060 RepID=UPI0039770E95
MSGDALDRRTVLTRVAAFSASLTTLLGLGYAGSRPVAAVEADDRFLADDVRVERNDGELQAVTVEPTIDIQWIDFGGGIDSIDVTISAALVDAPGFDVLLDASVDDDSIAVDTDGFDETEGTASLAFDRLDVTATGTHVTLDDFGGDLAPGASTTTEVELTMRIDVVGHQGETVTTVETTRFDLTVHNPEGTATTTGRANTGAE